ncbi:hypothetical protein BIV59_13000 [Bacillus sp. MUM 13]|nr:hypothetical protein BIV59_13000 [Bacillus sp. MUM 13]
MGTVSFFCAEIFEMILFLHEGCGNNQMGCHMLIGVPVSQFYNYTVNCPLYAETEFFILFVKFSETIWPSFKYMKKNLAFS